MTEEGNRFVIGRSYVLETLLSGESIHQQFMYRLSYTPRVHFPAFLNTSLDSKIRFTFGLEIPMEGFVFLIAGYDPATRKIFAWMCGPYLNSGFRAVDIDQLNYHMTGLSEKGSWFGLYFIQPDYWSVGISKDITQVNHMFEEMGYAEDGVIVLPEWAEDEVTISPPLLFCQLD